MNKSLNDKPLSERLNNFILTWFDNHRDLFQVYSEPQFNLGDVDETFYQFSKHFKEKGTIPMWYDDNQDNIFSSVEVNAKFRAWHDYMHVVTKNDFSLQGEIFTYRHQRELLPTEWTWERALLQAEIIGQAMHYTYKDEIILSQRDFAIKYIHTNLV